ncbi:serine/threonine-protein kinase [Corallococcus macrosporus]|uniref:Serine/threonine protein kinase n=1 Tax=Corallococcus macrosporus DSM 14697 TaxID=1189310 RepID=A0A250JVY2_9BACT|nr:serine/threonine-protein kinase [Corallococcus macrosporus]ATB48029.1 serine/threonine protein kinase [Corallococcus macrosporus DSM 14697]
MSATYRLTGKVEGGELAELYQGIELPGIPVVVKLFHPRTSDPAYAHDLAETTRLLQPVRHPGILHVVDLGVVRQRLAVVREDVDGFTLGTALQRLHSKDVMLPPTVALHIVIQLLEALHQAHEAGVVHGAITPGNVVLSQDGLPAVCDFGALRALMAVPQLRKSFGHRGRGTYRAPEVTRGEPHSAQSDIYSLGAIAYELLTQREPVVSGSGGVSTRRSESLPPPSRVDRRINSRLDPLILRALEPTPQRRFRSCGEFAASLRNHLAASGGMPTADDVRRFVRELFPNEMSLVSAGAPPFKEPFTLEPISGAEMDDLRAEELEKSVVQRAPYSRSLTAEDEADAETEQASGPMFEDYRPELYEPDIADVATRLRPPARASAAPPADEETGPAPAGPLEQGWEAPPGAAPPKPRRQQAAAGSGHTRIGRNPRLKVVEDFSSPEPSEDDEGSVSVSAPGRRGARVRRAPAEAKGPKTIPDALPAVHPARPRGRDDIAMPPSDPALPSTSDVHRRLVSAERRLSVARHRYGRRLGIAAAIAGVGLVSFLFAAWQRDGNDAKALEEAPVEAPAAKAAEGPPPPMPIAPPEEARRPPPPAPAPREDAEDAAVEPKVPPKSQRAYVTITTNVPATVYVDGARLNRRTPLNRYPVRMGTRRIKLVSVATGEPKELDLRLRRGQHLKVLVDSFTLPRR